MYRVHYNSNYNNHKHRRRHMEQLELPFKPQANTYESYSDAQKIEYWRTSSIVKSNTIDCAINRLKTIKKLLRKLDHNKHSVLYDEIMKKIDYLTDYMDISI